MTSADGGDRYVYGVSLGPSRGLNATWVGGNQIGEMGFDRVLLGVYGRFYGTSLGEVRHPARLMVFTSARGEDPLRWEGSTGRVQCRGPAAAEESHAAR